MLNAFRSKGAAVVATASVSLFSGGLIAGAFAATADATYNPYMRCYYALNEHCYAQKLTGQVRGYPNCTVYRGEVSGRVGATQYCPGSPDYVY